MLKKVENSVLVCQSFYMSLTVLPRTPRTRTGLETGVKERYQIIDVWRYSTVAEIRKENRVAGD